MTLIFSRQFKRLSLLAFLFFTIHTQSACNTGFGEPCKLPQTDNVKQACQPPANMSMTEEDDENQATQELKTSCAIENYPVCETQICMIYRNSSPFCTMRCQADGDCEGGLCCPLFGECNETTTASCADGTNTCYCIRKADKE